MAGGRASHVNVPTAIGLVVSCGLSYFAVDGLWLSPNLIPDKPLCGKGYQFFRDYMKCDMSLHYCYEYSNTSCLGPYHWSCVHKLERRVKEVNGDDLNLWIKNIGLGNTRCCGGNYQSPIDIRTSKVKCCQPLPTPFYLKPIHWVKGVLENVGNYLKFRTHRTDYGVPLELSGVPFTCTIPGSEVYVFTAMHIHTGGHLSHSSEHFVNGKAYVGEMHLMHVRKDFYKPSGIDERCASQTPLGLTTIAIFLSLQEGERNNHLDEILSAHNLNVIQQSQDSCDFDKICGLGDSSKEVFRPLLDPAQELFISDSNSVPYIGPYSSMAEPFSAIPYPSNIISKRSLKSHKRTVRSSGNQGSKINVTKRQFRLKRRGLAGRLQDFCHRQGYSETLMSELGRGEELACRNKYRFGSVMKESKKHPIDCSSTRSTKPCELVNVIKDFAVNPSLLLPRNHLYWQYFGSLTRPPCSEVVNWLVMQTPLKITLEQVMLLRSLESRVDGIPIYVHGNARPIQPLNGRSILTNEC